MSSCSVDVPDLLDYIATSKTLEELEQVMWQVIAFDIESLREDDIPILRATSVHAYVELQEITA